jgi:hypothetical protein
MKSRLVDRPNKSKRKVKIPKSVWKNRTNGNELGCIRCLFNDHSDCSPVADCPYYLWDGK